MYPKITDIHIENFMSLEDVVLSFDSSNILFIEGYNDSGKSAVERALAVFMSNAYKSKQTKFIKDGTNYFKISMNFDDGVKITYKKSIDGSTLYEMYKDGELIFDTRKGDIESTAKGIPKVISEYLSVCTTDEGLFLNHRSTYDKQLLVQTTGSENYAALNSILKTVEISRAVKMINMDRNATNTAYTDSKRELEAAGMALERYQGIDSSLLSRVREASLQEEASLQKLDTLKSIYDKLYSRSQVKSLPEISVIDLSRVRELGRLLTLTQEYSSQKEKVLSDLPKIKTDNLNLLIKIKDLLTKKQDLESTSQKLDLQRHEYVDKREKFMTKLQESGIKYKKCDNCGSYVVL